MFKYFVIGWGIEFGMVAAAIQGKVDCVDYISHLIVLIRAYCSSACAPFTQSWHPRLMKASVAND
jgi:hypothetical protein